MRSKAGSRTMVMLFLAIVSTTASCIAPVVAKPNVLTVPHPYRYIHEAIDAANPGDTIVVSEGLYSEGEIIVYKPLTLIAEGEVVVDGTVLYPWWDPRDRVSAVFLVTSDNVTIRGFTIVNTFTYLGGAAGVRLYDEESGRHVSNCKIEQNTFERNYFGVSVIGFENIIRENSFEHNMFDVLLGGSLADVSGLNVVENNMITGSAVGILVHGNSNHNTIYKNSIAGSGAGIALDNGTHCNTVLKNEITDNGRGIEIAGSHNNTIRGNVISGNRNHGIHLHRSSEGNVIRDNTVLNTSHIGIYLQEVSGNIVKRNTIRENQDGIYLESSDRNTLGINIVMKNTRYGIAVTMQSDQNKINKNLALHNREFDLYWDGTGTDNTWTKNKYRTRNW